jgi:cyclopropane fatty-acyl-phospholipid synthase-like methyltransferase
MELNEDKTLQASVIFNKYAKEYQDKFMKVSLYEDSLNVFCNLIVKENSRILDLGCGPGNITKYLLSQKSDLIVMGIDLAPNMVLLAQSNNPGASFEVMDCRSIANLTEKFDAVVCTFCIPYLSKEETNKLISNVKSLLNEGGIFYLSTMEDYYKKSGYETGSNGDQIFVHYYEGQYLINALEKKNFDIVGTFRKSNIMSNGKEVVDLVIISKSRNGL